MIEMKLRVLPAREFRSTGALDDDSLVAGNAFLGGKCVENLKKPNKDHHDICGIENEGNDRN